MKKIILVIVGFLILTACQNDDVRRDNPFLLNLRFDVNINLNLPQFSVLNFPGNAIYLGGFGNEGIIVVNAGGSFLAWDAADPNLVPQPCSRMQIQGLVGVSQCNPKNTYSLITGQPLEDGLLYGLFNYRLQQSGNIIRVFN